MRAVSAMGAATEVAATEAVAAKAQKAGPVSSAQARVEVEAPVLMPA